jgi:Ca-activated chloride channel family protein
MKALEYEEAAPYAEYGIGSVYLALGEDQAALNRFAEAKTLIEAFPAAVSGELRYRINYNTGVVLFSEGNFPAAADSFRDALRADSGKVEAKRNLELSIRSLSRENRSTGGDGGETESTATLFEYIRQKELNHWKSREWPEEEDTGGPDY